MYGISDTYVHALLTGSLSSHPCESGHANVGDPLSLIGIRSIVNI